MKAIGRFINRGAGEGDGLLIGAMFNGHPFKPNTIYEIVEVLGVLQIREVGQSIIAENDQTYKASPVGRTWGESIANILNLGAKLFLSRTEYADVKATEHREYLIRIYDLATIEKWEAEGRDLSEISD